MESNLNSPILDNREANPRAQGVNLAASSEVRSWTAARLHRMKLFEALRYPDYRVLWTVNIFSSMATWMDQVTRGWLIYEITGSSFQLGLVRGIQALPILLLAPIAGSMADRYSRKTQMTISMAVEGLLYGWLALLIFIGTIAPWHVYVSSVIMAAVWTFQQPARASMISDMVPSQSLTNAIGLNSTIFNLARIIGPAVAGVIISVWNTGGAYSVQAALYFLSTLWMVKLHDVKPHAPGAKDQLGSEREFFRSIVDGWKFSWRNLEVRSALLVTASASLFILPFSTVLPVFARDLLVVGARGQGLLLTSMGIGALTGSILIASLGARMPRGRVMIGGVGIYGLLVVLFALSNSFPLSMTLMAVMGLCHVASHALVQTIIQTHSPREYRGRTMALFHQTHVVLMTGSLILGGLASLIGARSALAAMSLAGIGAIIAICAVMPAARRIK